MDFPVVRRVSGSALPAEIFRKHVLKAGTIVEQRNCAWSGGAALPARDLKLAAIGRRLAVSAYSEALRIKIGIRHGQPHRRAISAVAHRYILQFVVVENRFESGPARQLEFSNCIKRVEPISQFIGIARSKDVKPSKRLAETDNWGCPLAHSLGLLREQNARSSAAMITQ